jgi:SAM-dependent methyltransferase
MTSLAARLRSAGIERILGAVQWRKRRLFAWLRAQRGNLFESSERIWRENLPEEVAYWEDWIRTKGGKYSDDFAFRLDPDAGLQEEIIKYVRDDSCKILDVGAGPFTYLGKTRNGRRVDITAVDPLADDYEAILVKHQVEPPVRTLRAEAEKLSELFAPSSFDIAYARNCLDHSSDPVRAIDQMLLVTKPGGIVYLSHRINEGQNEQYSGLHRWNFQERNGDFMITSPGRRSANITKRVKTKAKVTAATVNGWVVVVLEKRAFMDAG